MIIIIIIIIIIIMIESSDQLIHVVPIEVSLHPTSSGVLKKIVFLRIML